MIRLALILACLWASVLPGCRRPPEPGDALAPDADAQILARWGKTLSSLPVRQLVAISANNENIQNEFARAFSRHHALAFGQRVDVEWRDVGGGGGQIGRYLENEYKRHDSAGIDVLWGGGDQAFRQLAKARLFEPLDLPPDLLNDNVIPPALGGVELVDPDKLWVGSALSGFGIIYNAQLLDRFGIAPPTQWDDLADPRFADLLVLTDPTASSSAAAAYRMIAQTGATWPEGWGKLLQILANAKRFTNNAGSAANAPLVGEALASACIDFYGLLRVAESDGKLVYLSPPGQTVFTPDPIAILKNPPDRELARRFVDFVLSRQGQALLALRPGAPDGPARSPLARQPIRQDVYVDYAANLLPRLTNPYLAGQAMALTAEKTGINYNVLRLLVRTATVDNLAGLRAARNSLLADPARRAEFLALPPEAATLGALAETAKELSDPKFADDLATRWQAYFADKYRRVAR